MATIKMTDLTSIKGISEKRAGRLQNKLEIMNIKDLAMANVDDVYDALCHDHLQKHKMKTSTQLQVPLIELKQKTFS